VAPFEARVCRVDRGAVDVLLADGSVARAVIPHALHAAGLDDPAALPTVGDRVRVDPDGGLGVEVGEVLPRSALFVRAVADERSRVQVLAANLDVVAITLACFPYPDLGRLERFLALAWESGSQPAVLLTKSDLVADLDDLLAEVVAVAPGCAVLAVSALTGQGVAEVRALCGDGLMALLGSSGAGKSSLLNALAGQEVMAVQEIRQDGKGRHTTVHRELVLLAGGGAVIDSPGLRSVGLAAVDEGLDRAFDEISGLAEGCRFGDCAHDGEPGCAVAAALESGSLDARRLESWRKLRREAAYMARRVDARLAAAERATWRARARQYRQSQRFRP